MRYIFIIFSIFGFASAAIAADFDGRIAAGKRIEATPKGRQYLDALGIAYGIAMRACIPPGSSDSGNLGSFELVADVSSEGHVGNVDVRPNTRISLCFVRELSAVVLPAPPLDEDNATYPIYVEMKVVR